MSLTIDMKKIIRSLIKTVFVMFLMFSMAGCSRKQEKPEEVAAPVQEEVIQETEETAKPEEPIKEEEKVPEEIPAERIDVVFLGRTGEDRDLEQILNRAVESLGWKQIRNIDDRHIVYGVNGNENNVFLLLPKEGVRLTIYYLNATETLYQKEDGLPVIYVEKAGSSEIRSVLSVRHKSDKTEESFYVCFDPSKNTVLLNDPDQLSGISDLTDYDFFTEEEIPDNETFFVDHLYNFAPYVSEELQSQEYEAADYGWMIYEDRLYFTAVISDVTGAEKSYLYALRYDEETKKMEYLLSTNGKEWYAPGGE